jgi:tRNA (pseudouridine54-N1)-methyltransferase
VRDFVVCAHAVPIDGPDSLDDLPGAGRLDLLARCVLSGLLVSHGLREDARVHLVCRDTVTVRFDGRTLRGLHPDERSTAARIRDALAARDEAIGRQPAPVAPGIEVRRGGLETTLDAVDASPVQLHADGEPLSGRPPTEGAFVLSDHRAFTDSDRAILDDRNAAAVSIGPETVHADDAIAVVHNYLDTDGHERYERNA